MSSRDQQEAFDQQRRDQYHQAQMAGGDPDRDDSAQLLQQLSEIDDLPIDSQDDDVLGQLVSKLASTANLTSEQVRSNEWVREYLLILYLCQRPRKEGVHGTDRAWSHDDPSAAVDPLDANRRIVTEAHVMNSKLALTRSEEFAGVKEATRDLKESIVHDEASQGNQKSGIRRLLGK